MSPVSAHAAAIHLPRSTVLLVDDSPAVLEATREQLWAYGVRVRIAHSGEECLRMAPDKQPDLVLLDVLMPGMDGFETCRRLKDDPLTRDIPVIFMTALSQTEDKLLGFEAGGVDFVTKPIDIGELIARIATHLALRGAQRSLQQETETHRRTTAELQSRSQQLADAMDRLLRGEQLLITEKMVAAGELSAGIAHEIANPAHAAFIASEELQQDLGKFQAFLRQLAGDDAPTDVLAAINERFSRLAEAVAIIRDSASRVRLLAQDLRVFARRVERVEISSIRTLLESTANLVRAQFRQDVSLEVEFIDDPQVHCNLSRLGQVFMNLLVNACQSVRQQAQQVHGLVGRVNVTVRIAADALCIDVVDNGAGVSADAGQRIFEPFFTTKPAGEGTGLGLSMSQRIIHDHGGRIDVESTPGEGACFTVRLPLQPPP